LRGREFRANAMSSANCKGGPRTADLVDSGDCGREEVDGLGISCPTSERLLDFTRFLNLGILSLREIVDVDGDGEFRKALVWPEGSCASQGYSPALPPAIPGAV
jgi:hypothetical protein